MTYKRKEVIGDASLYLGDCLEVMPTLEPADLCVSDVPYKLTTGGVSKSSKTMSGIFAAHNYRNDGELVMATVTFEDMAGPIFEALKADADCYIMANDKNVSKAQTAFEQAGFGLHNLLAWDKVTPTANRWYMKNMEFTLYLWKGRAKTINDPSSKQGVRGAHKDVSKHPTEKPVWLMSHYITNSSTAGQTVLDPFMGSGTTGVAAIRTGRKFVGIEIDPEHFETALRRLENTRAEPFLIEPSATPSPQPNTAITAPNVAGCAEQLASFTQE